jgi:protein-tyrosine phosphatase
LPLIDLHCHLLPGVDDGPRSLSESIELARALEADGVGTVAATPHVRDDHPDVVPTELAGRCAELQDALESQGVELRVVPGGELDLGRAVAAEDAELRLVSLGQRGDLLLVETPYGDLTPLFEEQLFELELRGYRILLAHPERNPTFHAAPGRLAAVAERGILLQVTAGSLVRRRRRSPTSRLARTIVRSGLAHVLASDAHGRGLERESLSAGLEVARGLAGERADLMVTEIPAALLAGRPLPAAPANPPAAGLLRRLRLRG